jgi:hypothetical protein
LRGKLHQSTAEFARPVVRLVSKGISNMRLHTLSLAALAAALAAPAMAQTAMPMHVAGELTAGDAKGEEDHRYDDIRVHLEQGQRYRLSVDSEAFDPVAHLYRPGNVFSEESQVAMNDDSDGLNARISYTPPESGDYVLRVIGFAADARGAYTADVALLPPLAPPITTPGTPTAVNGTWLLWEGDLGDTDADAGGHRYDDYLIHVDAHQIRYISLEGLGFDAMVQILLPANRGSDAPDFVDSDDDSGVGLNALMAFSPDEGGDYIVRVTSFGENARGAYRLWITP